MDTSPNKSVAKPVTKSVTTTNTITFVFDKETKNTIRYKETSRNPIMQTIYIQKHALSLPIPTSVDITLTIHNE